MRMVFALADDFCKAWGEYSKWERVNRELKSIEKMNNTAHKPKLSVHWSIIADSYLKIGDLIGDITLASVLILASSTKGARRKTVFC